MRRSLTKSNCNSRNNFRYSHDALFQENKKLKNKVLELETQLLKNKPVWVYEREIIQLREQLKKAIKKSASVQQALVERDNQMARIAKMIGSVVSGLTQGQFEMKMMQVDQNDEIEADTDFMKTDPQVSKTKQICCDVWDQSVDIMQQAIQALLDRLWNLEKRNRDLGDEHTKGSNTSRRHARLKQLEMENASKDQIAPTGIISPPPEIKELSKSAVNIGIVADDSDIQVSPEAEQAPAQRNLVTPTEKKSKEKKTVQESPGSSLGPYHPPHWVPNDFSNQCMGCQNQFLFLITSKHHCRRCGGLFCGTCSNFRDYVPPFYIDKKVRVCKACHLEKEAERKERKRLFEQHQLFSGM